jgi:hypothetical protein
MVYDLTGANGGYSSERRRKAGESERLDDGEGDSNQIYAHVSDILTRKNAYSCVDSVMLGPLMESRLPPRPHHPRSLHLPLHLESSPLHYLHLLHQIPLQIPSQIPKRDMIIYIN